MLRLLKSIPRDASAWLGHHRQVVIGPDGQGDTPITTRAARIEHRCLGKGPCCFVVIEGPEERMPWSK